MNMLIAGVVSETLRACRNNVVEGVSSRNFGFGKTGHSQPQSAEDARRVWTTNSMEKKTCYSTYGDRLTFVAECTSNGRTRYRYGLVFKERVRSGRISTTVCIIRRCWWLACCHYHQHHAFIPRKNGHFSATAVHVR